MSTSDELNEKFLHDEEDDTYSLEVWFTRQAKETLVRFCIQHQVGLNALIKTGIECIVEATESRDGAIIVKGLPSSN